MPCIKQLLLSDEESCMAGSDAGLPEGEGAPVSSFLSISSAQRPGAIASDFPAHGAIVFPANQDNVFADIAKTSQSQRSTPSSTGSQSLASHLPSRGFSTSSLSSYASSANSATESPSLYVSGSNPTGTFAFKSLPSHPLNLQSPAIVSPAPARSTVALASFMVRGAQTNDASKERGADSPIVSLVQIDSARKHVSDALSPSQQPQPIQFASANDSPGMQRRVIRCSLSELRKRISSVQCAKQKEEQAKAAATVNNAVLNAVPAESSAEAAAEELGSDAAVAGRRLNLQQLESRCPFLDPLIHAIVCQGASQRLTFWRCACWASSTWAS
jgi:hypothetical protein